LRKYKMANCEAGNCSCECGRGGGCGCVQRSEDPDDCDCYCYHNSSSVGRFSIIKGRKIPFKAFKPGIKVTTQTKFNICTRDLPLKQLAELLDKYLPNKIVVPTDRAPNRVTLSLKNKTLRQIINRSGLILSVAAEAPVKTQKRQGW
jgi:hypothetical protein